MSEAIVGLVGVVVGGLIQGGGTWLLARRTDRQTARGAARMAAGELMRAMHRMNEVVQSGAWGDLAMRPIEMTRWRDHEPLFAATITHDERWLDVYNAYRYCEHVNDAVALTRNGKQGLTDEQRDEVDRASHLVLRGAMALTAIGYYGPARWSVRRGLARLRGMLPVSDERIMNDVQRRLDPRDELPPESDYPGR